MSVISKISKRTSEIPKFKRKNLIVFIFRNLTPFHNVFGSIGHLPQESFIDLTLTTESISHTLS